MVPPLIGFPAESPVSLFVVSLSAAFFWAFSAEFFFLVALVTLPVVLVAGISPNISGPSSPKMSMSFLGVPTPFFEVFFLEVFGEAVFVYVK